MKSERKIGAGLSYVSTILNSLVSIFITPFILVALGDVEYGIYRSVSALTGQLALVSIGVGTMATVMVARYNAREDGNAKKERENFLAMAITASVLISLLVLVIGGILFVGIDGLYAKTLSEAQLSLTKRLYVLLVLNVALYLMRDVFTGIINGYEKFAYSGLLKVFRIVFRVILILILLNLGFKSIGLVVCDLIVSITLILLDLVFCFGKLKVKARFYYFDKILFKTMFTFSAAILLQTIVNQVNQNLDSVILGAMIVPERVTVYSLALTIYVAYNGVGSAISSLFTPEAARLVQKEESQQVLQSFTVKVGRIQLLVNALILGGFICIGRDFVSIWAGSGKEDVYLISLILLIPACFANTLCGSNSLLDGYMKRMGRSVILVIMAVYNVVSSIIMIHFIDYWGAALGTATSVIVGQICLMCWYYKKIFNFDIKGYFRDVLKGIFPAFLLAATVGFATNLIPCPVVLVRLLLGGAVFCLVYGIVLIRWGLRAEEKEIVLRGFRKVAGRRRKK